MVNHGHFKRYWDHTDSMEGWGSSRLGQPLTNIFFLHDINEHLIIFYSYISFIYIFEESKLILHHTTNATTNYSV